VFSRNDDSVLAKMNVLFDKDKFVRSRSFAAEEPDDGEMVKRAIRDSLALGRVGSLTVDPNYLDFEPVIGELKREKIFY
jgi:hypothetical protein